MTLDFPVIESPNYPADRLWTWWEKGSTPGLEGLSRFPFFGLWHGLTLLGLDVSIITKLNIVLGFCIASFSFYFSFWFLFKKILLVVETKNEIALSFAAILGALFYAYNPWSFERTVHWYLWIGYGLLPLFFTSTVFAFRDHRNWKYIITSITVWTFASSTPHMTVFYGFIFVCIFLAFVIKRLLTKEKTDKKKAIFRISTNLLVILFLFSLVNLFWIYPYLLSTQIRSVSPNYVLVEENLETLSKQNDLHSTLTLIGNWQEQQEGKPFQNSTLNFLWLYSGIALPIFALSAFLFSRRLIKFTIIFAITALVGILLAMGTQSPYDYFGLMLGSPLLTKYMWLFRDPDKWSFLIAFGYSFLIGITSYSLLRFFGRLSYYRANIFITSGFLLLLIGTIVLYSYPVYRSNMDVKFRPIILPSEFDKLNTYLSTLTTDKVFFIPYPQEETQWNKLNRVGDIYQMHSIKPSIESTGFTGMASMGTTNYYNYLEKSIIGNRSKNISDSFLPLGSSYIIFHNDTWDNRERSLDPNKALFMRQLYTIDELENVHNVGFYRVFRVDGNRDSQQFNIFGHNIASLGGLKAQSSLNEVSSFSSLNSSLLFVDDIHTKHANEMVENSDYIMLEKSPSFGDLFFALVDEKYIIQPFTETNRYEPTKVWSKSGATDPDFGVFHPHLEGLGMQNWEFDYGKGLVITQAMGAKIAITTEIQESGEYDLFLRYLKNQKGGPIRVYFDDRVIREINSEDYERSSNNFVWENLGSSLNISKGKHTIMLENVAGFNAVNILAAVHTNEITKLENYTYSLANRTKNVYLLEAESDFYNNKGEPSNYSQKNSSGSLHPLFEYRGEYDFNKNLAGQFRVPPNADLMSLQFIANSSNPTVNSSNNNTSYYAVGNLQIYPSAEKYDIFSLDFERDEVSIPLAALRQQGLTNRDEDDMLSTSLESYFSTTQSAALRVNIKQDNASDWSILSTDYIPVGDKRYYNFSLDVSAKDVRQLHANVLYYDSDKERIKSEIVSEGRDGTFIETLTSSVLPPLGTKYVRFEILVIPNDEKSSSYLIDNLKFEEIIPKNPQLDNDFARFQSVAGANPAFPFEQKAEVDMGPMEGVISNNNSSSNGFAQNGNDQSSIYAFSTAGNDLLKTKPIPVKENSLYNYTIHVEGQNLHYFAALASFRNSSDVAENSTKYGATSSNGKVLSLSPGSEIYTELDILKPSNYTIALRASTCNDRCSDDSILAIRIEREDPNGNTNDIIKLTNISLSARDNTSSVGYEIGGSKGTNMSSLKWIYLHDTNYLERGKYKIKIHSPSQVDLDSMVVYSTAHDPGKDVQGDARKQYETLEDLFSLNNSSGPANLADYKKIDPTKYEVRIENATRPYVISLAESYDPLWVAHVNRDSNDTNLNIDDDSNSNSSFDFRTRSVPLFSIVNGFLINKTGDYTLTIEYEPQKWLFDSGIISTGTVIAILVYLVLVRRTRTALYRLPHKKALAE
jgi:hypothetical protein